MSAFRMWVAMQTIGNVAAIIAVVGLAIAKRV